MPSLHAYIDSDEHTLFADEFHPDELTALETAFDMIESAFITLHAISHDHAKVLHTALAAIFDNARDLDPDDD